jgi:myo-inositol-1(or 4)-monophosphatase
VPHEGLLDDDLLDELSTLAAGLARRAADLLLEGMASVPELLAAERVGTKSSATDMVSEVDRASERLLVEGILAARPDDGILGEEGTDRPGRSGVRWVIDPLDGTTNFLYGLPGFAVSIGVEIAGRGVVGAVLDPVHGELFAATLGRGATMNGAAIHCTTVGDLGLSLIGTGFGYEAAVRAEQADVLRTVVPAVRDIRRFGAAAVDLCSVACGRLDGYYEVGLQPWDLAAGGLIATEAGAVLGWPRGGAGRRVAHRRRGPGHRPGTAHPAVGSRPPRDVAGREQPPARQRHPRAARDAASSRVWEPGS